MERAGSPADMDPLSLTPGQWDQVARLLVDLTSFAGLALTAAFAFLLGRAVLPTIGDEPATGAAGDPIRTVRLALYPLAVASAIAMLVALARGLNRSIELLRDVYPRFLI